MVRVQLHGFLFRLVLIFSGVIVIATLATSYLGYVRSRDRLKDELARSSRIVAAKVQGQLDTVINDARSEALRIAFSDNVRQLLAPGAVSDIFDLSQRYSVLLASLEQLRTADRNLSGAFVWFVARGHFVGNGRTLEVAWNADARQASTRVREIVAKDPGRGSLHVAVIESKGGVFGEGPALLTIAAVPVARKIPQAYVILTAPLAGLDSLVDARSIPFADSIEVLGAGSILLPSKDFGDRSNPVGRIVTTSLSAAPWSVSIYASARSIARYLAPYRRWLLLTSAIVLVLGIAAIYFFSLSLYQPVRALYRSAVGSALQPGRRQDELSAIGATLASLEAANLRYAEVLEANFGLIRSNVLLNILREGTETSNWESINPTLRLNFRADRPYQLVLVHIRRWPNMDDASGNLNLELAKSTLSATLSRRLPGVDVCDLSGRDLLAVKTFDVELSLDTDHVARAAIGLVKENGLEAFAFRVPVSDGTGTAPELFEQVQQVVRAPFHYLTGQIHDTPSPSALKPWDVSRAEVYIQGIAGALAHPDPVTLESFVNQIVEFVDGSDATIVQARLFLARLVATTEEVAERKGAPTERFLSDSRDVYAGLSADFTLANVGDRIRRMLGSFIEMNEDLRRARRAELMAKVATYLSNNFRRDISLDHVAEAVGITPQYLSGIFRQHFEVNYKDYLTTLRVNEATRMLELDPSRSLQELARLVGFTNKATFYRAFRSKTGMTPGEYRSRA